MRLFKFENGIVLCAAVDQTGATVSVREGVHGETLAETRVTSYDSERAATNAVNDAASEYEAKGYRRAPEPEPHAATFFQERFPKLLADEFRVRPAAPSTALVEEIESIIGRPLTGELREHFLFRGSVELGWCNFGEWRIWSDDVIPFDFEQNVFEQLLTDFSNFTLQSVMADAVSIGTAGNGDNYVAFLDVAVPEGSVVFLWDHETGELNAFADGISTLAELNRLYGIDSGNIEISGDPLDEIKRGMKRIESRVAPSWHYESLVKNSGAKPSFEAKASSIGFQWFRSFWITSLLDGELRAVPRWLEPLTAFHQNQMKWEELKGRTATQYPSRALYWLFWAYFFERPELADIVETVANSPSRLVRDAATVFRQLLRGERTKVGEKDFVAMRRRFGELDIDPAKKEAKARALALAAEEKKARQQAATEEAAAWAEGKSASDIAAEMWRRVDVPAAMKALAAALVERRPELDEAHRRARAIIAERQNLAAIEALALASSPEERAMLALALACAGPAAMGPIVEALTGDERGLVAHHGKELIARLRTWLRTKYDANSAISALSLLGALSDGELSNFVMRFRWKEESAEDEESEDEESEDEESEDEESEDEESEDEDSSEGKGGAATATKFGPVMHGAAALAKAEPETSEDSEVDEDSDDDDDSDEESDGDDEPDSDDDSDDESGDDDSDDDDSDDDDSDDDDSDDDDSDDDDSDDDDSDDESDDDDSADDDSDESEAASDEPADSPKVAPPERDPHDVTLEDENPLVERPAYLRSMFDKAPLRATIAALAKSAPKSAFATLESIVVKGPADVRVQALIAVAQLPGDEARVFVEQQLEGTMPRIALYALARRGDGAALAAVERVLSRREGLADVLVYERVMREAVRSAAGQPVDLAVVRLGLQTVMDNKFAAIELHEIALEIVAKHAQPDEARAFALAFLDAEQLRIRQVAARLLSRIDPSAKPRVLDDATIASIHAVAGVDGLREALRDPLAIHRDQIVAFAQERGLLGALEAEVIALAEHMARFPLYTNGYERDGHDRTEAVIRALFTLESPAVDAALHRFITSANASTRKAFQYEDEVRKRLEKIGALTPASRTEAVAGRSLADTADVREVRLPSFVLGAPVHAIAFVHDAVIVAGGGRIVAFDRTGAPHPQGRAFTDGWAYDVAVHEGAGVVVIGYSHGHCIVYGIQDGTGFVRREDLSHRGGVRKVAISPSGKWLATACDDKTLHVWNLESLTEARRHDEPYDVNTVAWLDEETLAFATDHHVGILPREGGEPRRHAVQGGSAELRVVEGKLLVGTGKNEFGFVEPKTFEVLERFPVGSVARARLSTDGKTLYVASWDGAKVGFSRWDRATKKHERISDESLFGMEMDPESGRIFVGGKSGRVTVLSADGHAESDVPEMRDEQRSHDWLVLPASTDAVKKLSRGIEPNEIDILDASGKLVRFDIERKLTKVLATAPRPLPHAAEDVALLAEGGAVVAAFDAVTRYGFGLDPWSRTTERCEKVLVMGGVVVATSGRSIGFLDPKTGETLAEVDAGIESSWVHYLEAVDDDRFFLCGYDEGRLQLWSASQRKRIGERVVEHRHDDGRFARPYGISVHRPSQRLLVAYWDYQVDVFSLEGSVFGLQTTLSLHDAYEFVALTDDGETFIAADEHGVLAFSYPSCVPKWRWNATHKLCAMTTLGDGRVVVGAEDGAVVVLRGRDG